MMYLALTYDHRIVDGREAVSFLKRLADCIENRIECCWKCKVSFQLSGDSSQEGIIAVNLPS